MGAGARMAEERDRWPDDWQMADLEPEDEHLIDLLEQAEELRAVVPGVRRGPVGPSASAHRCHRSPDRSSVGRWPVADVDAAVA